MKNSNEVISVGSDYVCLSVWCGKWTDAHGPLTSQQREQGDETQARNFHGGLTAAQLAARKKVER